MGNVFEQSDVASERVQYEQYLESSVFKWLVPRYRVSQGACTSHHSASGNTNTSR